MSNPKASDLGLETKADLPPPSPERVARETAALDAMVAGLNKEAGVKPPPPEPQVEKSFVLKVRQPGIGGGIIGTALNTIAAPAKPAPVTHARSPFNPRLLFYTGRLKAGKDFVAAATGATVFGFAEPLYAMRRVFFGEVDKDKHGAREILQLMGQWGRGTVSAQYPLNASRASFVMMARSLGPRGEFGDWAIDWSAFGRKEDIWLDGMLKRVERFQLLPGNEDRRVACVNVRFRNEHEMLTAGGWTHFHVLCSAATWEERIRAAGLDPKSPAMSDVSEQMAIGLDRQAAQAAQKNPRSMLRCIWNDDKAANPTPGALHSVQSFLADLEIFS